MNKKIAMLSQYGKPIRGLSPYSDSLFTELKRLESIQISQVDYKSPFPSFLHPAKTESVNEVGDLSWWNPFSWIRLAESDFDVIHIQHWLSPMSFYLLPVSWLSKRCGKKIIITVHNPEAHEHTFGFRIIETMFYKNTDAIIVHTEKGAKLLRVRTDSRIKIYVIPHGIEFTDLINTPKKNDIALEVGLDVNFKYIFIFGNLRGYKGVELLLNAWIEVSKVFPGVKLIVGGRLWDGQGMLSKVIATLIGTKKQSNVIKEKLNDLVSQQKVIYYPGFLSDKKINSLIRISEFCVFPYERFESQSGAACRSIGMGVPVLVSNVGGLPELAVDESWIFEAGNIRALVSALKSKIFESTNSANNAKCATLKEKFPFMAWSYVAKSTANVYTELFHE